MFHFDYDDYDYELEELRAEATAQRRYNNLLARHHDCRDPDHPGCERCEELDEDELEDEFEPDEEANHV